MACNDPPSTFQSSIGVAESASSDVLAPTSTLAQSNPIVLFLCALTDGDDPGQPTACATQPYCRQAAAVAAPPLTTLAGDDAMRHPPLERAAQATLSALALGVVVWAVDVRAAEPAAGSAASVHRLEEQNQALTRAVTDMQRQLLELQQQRAEMRRQTGALNDQQQRQAEAAKQATAEREAMKAQVGAAAQTSAQVEQQVSARAGKAEAWDKVSLWGYGEIYYLHPVHRPEQTRADLARAVFGMGYQFDDSTRFNSEYEVEHGVSSASDAGEFEVEQFYVEHKLSASVGARAGLFLIPAGLLNENHEPTNFYGVQRNFVETLIIPSTWREGGLSLFGTTDSGFDWNVGLTTGLDLSRWSFAPPAPPYTSAQEMINNDGAPMQATHQELALANGRRLSQYASLNYRAVPGLTVGATVFTGQGVPSQPGIASQRATLWETHGRYQPGRWDLSALYARGTFSHTAAANALYPGATNPLPAQFDGWFAQAAYNLWQRDSYRLATFMRYEKYDMGASYEGIAPGFSATPTGGVPNASSPDGLDYFAVPRDAVVTLGANFYLNPNVVLKFDYQRFRTNTDFTRLDLGLGLQF